MLTPKGFSSQKTIAHDTVYQCLKYAIAALTEQQRIEVLQELSSDIEKLLDLQQFSQEVDSLMISNSA